MGRASLGRPRQHCAAGRARGYGPLPVPAERRIAVCDLGSNSFRLVVFTSGTWAGHGWWRKTDEIFESVRIGAGIVETGELSADGIARGLATAEVFAHFCAATGVEEIDAVATSAIRDARNAEAFLDRA